MPTSSSRAPDIGRIYFFSSCFIEFWNSATLDLSMTRVGMMISCSAG